LLSLLGVTIGIFLIISIFTLVDSLETNIRTSLASVGDDIAYIEKMPWAPEPGDETYEWWRYFQRPNASFDEAQSLKERMSTASDVVFFGKANRNIEYGKNAVSNAAINVISEGYENFLSVGIEEGRNFTSAEIKSNVRMCILGFDIAEQLFPNSNPVGKLVKIAGFKATVIGVLAKEGESLIGKGVDEWVIVPIKFGSTLMNIRNANAAIAIKPKEFVEQEVMLNELTFQLRKLRKLRPAEKNNFAINRTSMLNNGMAEIFDILTVAGLLIGGFSILVGGFSIANIMFVSVRERTSIIGIQKALGAKRDFILFQFLFESVFLCALGGVIGLLFIWLGTFAVNGFTDFELILTFKNVLIGMAFAIGIGLVSGIVPASLAAKMEPVEAIRTNV
jgi:putative ABC transport system permease protein